MEHHNHLGVVLVHKHIIRKEKERLMKNTEKRTRQKSIRLSLANILRFAFAALLLLLSACDNPEGTVNSEALLLDTADERAAVDAHFNLPTDFVLKPGNVASVSWRYTTKTPSSSWNKSTFSDYLWSTGSPGFYGGGNVPQDAARTPWPQGKAELWLRTTFYVPSASDIPKLMFWGRWDDTIEIYINGVLAAKEDGYSEGYRYVGLTATGRAALKSGQTSRYKNTIAVYVRDTGGARYFDLGLVRNQTLTGRPMSGSERTPALAVFGNTVRQYMIEHGIPAGTLSVMKKDQVVVNRGFGWTTKAFTNALPANAVLRLASNDKIITLAAVRALEGRVDSVTGEVLSPGTRVFPLLAAHGITPLPGVTPDPRINTITIEQLLMHTSGLEGLPEPVENSSFYTDLQIEPGTSTMADNIRYVYSLAPRFDPGTQYEYSSTGYMALRYLVHVVTGDLLTFLRGTILAPVGTSDVFIAAEHLENRSAREPWYATLRAPFDRWVHLENFTGLSASSEAMVRFLRGYNMDYGVRLIDPVTGQWAALPEPRNYPGVFYGSMGGTFSITVQRLYDEVNIAVIFNIGGKFDDLTATLNALADSISAADWGI
jgi:CubicO group peptidase (beta-lactamase class C family)